MSVDELIDFTVDFCEQRRDRIYTPVHTYEWTNVRKTLTITREAISSKRRFREFVLTRALFCYAARNKLELSYTELGKITGRDHSSVQHLVKKVLPQDYKFVPGFKEVVDEYINELGINPI